MLTHGHIRQVVWFCTKFFLFVIPCSLLWWWALPLYAYILGHVTTAFLQMIVSIPIDGCSVEKAGLFNTGTTLVFAMAGREFPLAIADLVKNIPPFVALILATARLSRLRRVKALMMGLSVLVIGHALYIILAFSFAESISRSPAIPTALAQLFLTLPFLLWVVLACWDKLTSFAASEGPQHQKDDL